MRGSRLVAASRLLTAAFALLSGAAVARGAESTFATPPMTYMGCGTLKGRVTGPRQLHPMTIEACASACWVAKRSYAATLKGDQCACGDAYNAPLAGVCNKSCADNPGEICGGEDDASIFAIKLACEGVAGSDATPKLVVRLFFGADINPPKNSGWVAGEVSDAQWSNFLAQEVTPRFPDGINVATTYGQYEKLSDNSIVREKSWVLTLAIEPSAGADDKINAIAKAYNRDFNQESVMRIETAGCRSFLDAR